MIHFLLQVIICACCVVVSGLSLAVQCQVPHIGTLLVSIAGLLVVGVTITMMILRHHIPQLLPAGTIIPSYLFLTATGTNLLLDLPRLSNTLAHADIVITSIFTFTVLLMGASSCMFFCLPEAPKADIESPQYEKSSPTVTALPAPVSLDDIDNIIKSSIDLKTDSSEEYSIYKLHNWMDSGVRVQAQPLQQPMTVFAPTKAGDLLKSSASVPTLLKAHRRLSIKNRVERRLSDNRLSRISVEDRRVLLINSACTSESNLNGYLDDVKRSKSTSNIPSRTQRKEQRWKLIHDEKAFLVNVNENLLPSVLKKSESPIMEVKRKQEIIERDLERKHSLSPVGEAHSPLSRKSLELPYAYEFGESPSKKYVNFEGFDQDTAVVQTETNTPAVPYSETMSGLEAIPPSKKVWIPKLSTITLQDWHDNQESWNMHRTRLGANVTAIRVTSDHAPVDIDHLSDLSDECQPSSSRLFSAPSLHTFRNVSSQESKVIDSQLEPVESQPRLQQPIEMLHVRGDSILSSLENTLRHYTTPPPETAPSSSNASPIRKLFESPKRVFKRARASLDEPTHRHTASIVSNPISIALSTSPKRLLRTLIKKAPTAPPFPLITSHKSPMYIPEATTEALDFWDLDTAHDSDRSRVSSVPSAVIGEYDREKWRTIKALRGEAMVSEDHQHT